MPDGQLPKPVKIVIGIVGISVLIGITFWIYSVQASWSDTGTVTWFSQGPKQFVNIDNQGIYGWYTPTNFAISTLSHGTINFTDMRNRNPCPYCHPTSASGPVGTKVGVVRINNGEIDLYFDP